MHQQAVTTYLAWTASAGDRIPANAVVGGRDNTSREDLYIGRALESNDLIPGKVVKSHKVLYVAYGGQEKPHQNYEILVSDIPNSLKWVPSSGGHVPEHAVQGGHTKDGEPLYIARARAPDDGMCVGKMHPSHKCCYIPWGGEERPQKDYEVLTFP